MKPDQQLTVKIDFDEDSVEGFHGTIDEMQVKASRLKSTLRDCQRTPRHFVIFTVALIVTVAGLLAWYSLAHASPTKGIPESEHPPWLTRYTLDEVRTGITWLVKDDNIRANRDADYRESLALAFFENGNRFGVPQMLLVGMGYRENKFRMNRKGDNGTAWGIMQVRGQGRRRCRPKCNKFSMNNPFVQVCYGACWYDEIRTSCGCKSHQGLIGYVGGQCKRDAPRTRFAVSTRYKLWNRLHNLVRPPQ